LPLEAFAQSKLQLHGHSVPFDVEEEEEVFFSFLSRPFLLKKHHRAAATKSSKTAAGATAGGATAGGASATNHNLFSQAGSLFFFLIPLPCSVQCKPSPIEKHQQKAGTKKRAEASKQMNEWYCWGLLHD